MNNSKWLSLLLFFVSLFVSPLSNFAVAEAQPKPKVAILPFTVNAQEDLAYLKEGVRSMLASRLAAGSDVAVMSRAVVTRALADNGGQSPTEIGRTLGADVVVIGSITGLGPSVSLDVQAVRIGAESVTEGFFATAADQGEVIGAVDKLAGEIGARMFVEKDVVQARVAGKEKDGGETAKEPAEDLSLHPDRLFRTPGPVPAAAIEAPVPAVVTPVVQSSTAGLMAPVFVAPLATVYRSRFLDMELQVLDVGDVLGDGSEQLVLAEKHEIFLYRMAGGRLVKLADLPSAPSYVRIVAVNLADLDKDGRDEVYVSAISDNDPHAFAVKWNGNSFVKMFDKERWHIRPLDLPGRGQVLAGQKNDIESPVSPGIFVIEAHDGKLVGGEQLPVPDKVNLFEFVMADFTGDGQSEILTVDQDNDLALTNSTGDVLWSTDEPYNYTKRFIGPVSGTVSSSKITLQVPSRLIATDLNGDRRPELVMMKNPTGLTSLITTIGNFTGGEIQVMGWNGISFVEMWSTGKIGSYVTSYQLAKGGEEKTAELYVGLLSKTSGVLLNKIQTSVAGYKLANFTR